MKKALLMAAAGAASFAVSTSALAGDFDPWFAASRAGGFIDVWPARDFTAVMFGAELQFHLRKSVYLDISISGAAAEDNFITGGDVRFAYGNPTIGAHYAGQVTRDFHFFVGGTLTLPFLHDPDGDVAGPAFLTQSIRGYYDIDRFVLGAMAVRAMGGFEWNFVEPLYLRAEVRPVVYVRTRDAGINFRDDAELFIEHAAELEGRFRNGFGLGARVQAVGLPTVEGDQAQVVFEPFLAITPKKRGFYMKLGFPVALDEPLGFGLDENRLATGRIALGGQW
jgi:hypothetical protein